MLGFESQETDCVMPLKSKHREGKDQIQRGKRSKSRSKPGNPPAGDVEEENQRTLLGGGGGEKNKKEDPEAEDKLASCPRSR